MRWTFVILLATCLVVTTARSVTLSATDTVGDAQLTLALEALITVTPPSVNWCTVTIDVHGEEVALAEGDLIEIWVYEDDLVGNDLLYENRFVVTATEVSAQWVMRVFDCSSDPANLLGEPDNYAQIYAEALNPHYS
jgi:hypothetical protein